MHVTGSSVAARVDYSASARVERNETLRAWVDPEQDSTRVTLSDRAREAAAADLRADESPRSRGAERAAADCATAACGDVGGGPAMDATDTDPRLLVIKRMIESIVGHAIDIPAIRLSGGAGGAAGEGPAAPEGSSYSFTPQGEKPEGWGVDYRATTTTTETEQLAVAMEGEIHTADGRTIAIAASLQLSRAFSQTTSEHVALGDAARMKDPLVINYAGNAADLSGGPFQFDIDADGAKDTVAFVGKGSGFLALDANANGRIDDGRELFGPSTGSGFAELARHDSDGNGWIDEADPVFSKLKILTGSAEAPVLVDLARAGVGAIAVNGVDAPFRYADAANNTQGANRAAGLFLYEDGRAGTVQQIDLAV